MRTLALQQVDKELTDAGLLGADGKVSAGAQQQYSFTKTSSLPTPGILVKGCVDECSICEPSLDQEIELELQKKELENKLLHGRSICSTSLRNIAVALLAASASRQRR